MVMQKEYTPSERGLFEEPTHNPGTDYTSGQRTEGAPTQILVDKSQHITNYVLIGATGTIPDQFQTHTSPTGGVYVDTEKRVEEMQSLLREMRSTLDDPASFEERTARFVACLGEMEEEGSKREIHFRDLTYFLRMTFSSIEANEMTGEMISSLTEVVTALRETVTAETLRQCRHKLRSAGLDLLRPFKTSIDLKGILREMFPDENPA